MFFSQINVWLCIGLIFSKKKKKKKIDDDEVWKVVLTKLSSEKSFALKKFEIVFSS